MVALVPQRARLAAAAFAGLLAVAGPAAAQIAGNAPKGAGATATPAKPAATPATPAKPAGPATTPAGPAPAVLDAARAAWEARPMAERIDIQTGLVWTGDYAGALDGTFGRMTFEGVAAFQARHKFAADGIPTAPAVAKLAEVAATKRDGFGWRMVADAATGARLGVPTKLVGKPVAVDGGSRWTSADGRIELRSFAVPGQDLAGLFETLKAETPDRRVTYAVIRTDWFVIAETSAGRQGYTRFVRTPAGLRGFSLRHDPAIGPEFGRVVIATAGTFEGVAAEGTAAAGGQTAQPGPQPGPQSQPTGPATPPSPPKPAGIAASGLVVAPGRVLTAAAAVADCRSLAVGGRPASVAASDGERRLALLSVEGAAAPAGALVLADAAPGAAATLTVVASGPAGLAVTGGEVTVRGVRAALQRGGLGAAAFDASGRLVGVIAGAPDERRTIAGLLPQASYDAAGAEAIAAVLGGAGLSLERGAAGPARTTAAIVAASGARVVPIACGR